MTAAPLSVASTVVLPEENEEQDPAEASPLKRRRLSEPSPDQKRQKVSNENTLEQAHGGLNGRAPTDSQTPVNDRRRHGQMEERKRGQRLFGALLGTLSQSSSSTAQKRRADIENKQRDKLRMQAQEEDEKRQRDLSKLTVKRRKEQVIFDRQSRKIQETSAFAQAHFLRTKAQPSLFYRPWELLPDEEERIKKQISEAEAESVEDTRSPQGGLKEDREPMSSAQDEDQKMETTGPDSERPPDGRDSEEAPLNDTDKSEPLDPNKDWISAEQEEEAKENADDGDEEVQGDEDTVIY